MDDSYPCPKCGEDVPLGPAREWRVAGTPGATDPPRQTATCGNCEAKLVRTPEGPDKGWRLRE
jgi:hypothetical protein